MKFLLDVCASSRSLRSLLADLGHTANGPLALLALWLMARSLRSLYSEWQGGRNGKMGKEKVGLTLLAGE